jgi:hypothetical protein
MKLICTMIKILDYTLKNFAIYRKKHYGIHATFLKIKNKICYYIHNKKMIQKRT